MRVSIIGQRWLGATAADAFRGAGHTLVAVVAPSADDRLARAGSAAGARVVVSRRPRAQDLGDGVDLVVCAHAHAFVDAGVRSAARLGAIGYHPSLLPRHRGRDAIEWALRFRDPITGGTVYQLDDGADTGLVLLQDWCWIGPLDTAESLWRRELGPMGVRLLLAAAEGLADGLLVGRPQRPDVATWEPALTPVRLSEVSAR